MYKNPFLNAACFLIPIVGLVILYLIWAVLFPLWKLESVESECVSIAGQVMSKTNANYFILDTIPEGSEGSFRLQEIENNTLAAIRYANNELGFSDDVYSRMMNTSALMGPQSEENEHYIVSWTYHPDEGLVVKYDLK